MKQLKVAKRPNFALFVLGFLIFLGGAVAQTEDAGLIRVTSSFELKHAEALLKQVAKVFKDGFGRTDAETLVREINALPADKPQVWHYTVMYRGMSYPLQVRARLDDLGMLDLDFSTAAVPAAAVRQAVDGYLNAHGL